MNRRLQFSMKTLLQATFAVCVVLGAFRLLKRCEYIELTPFVAKPNQPITVRGRLIRLLAPSNLSISCWWRDTEGGAIGMCTSWNANRSWLVAYDFKVVMDAPEQLGQFEVWIEGNGKEESEHMLLTVR